MNILGAITDFVGGGLFKEIKETAMAYFPPDMSPEQKLKAEMAMDRAIAEKEKVANQVLNDAAAQLDKRIAEQEGTASDLKTIPFFGAVMLFLRGAQRPVWGFSTLYIDYKWFFDTAATFSEQQEMALTVINLLVLGFLFGERAVKNLEPLIMRMFDRYTKP